jgi:hypothetical protein
VKLGVSPLGDGKIACFRCCARTPLHLLHRVTFDKLQDPAARERRDRDSKPVWLCQRCWLRKWAVTS